MLASKHGNKPAVEALLAYSSVDVNAKDKVTTILLLCISTLYVHM